MSIFSFEDVEIFSVSLSQGVWWGVENVDLEKDAIKIRLLLSVEAPKMLFYIFKILLFFSLFQLVYFDYFVQITEVLQVGQEWLSNRSIDLLFFPDSSSCNLTRGKTLLLKEMVKRLRIRRRHQYQDNQGRDDEESPEQLLHSGCDCGSPLTEGDNWCKSSEIENSMPRGWYLSCGQQV